MKYLPLIFIYPLVFLWTFISGFTGMLFAVVFQSPQLTLSFVPGKMWAPVILWLLGVKVKVSGQEHLDDDIPSIFVANHSSFLDIPATAFAIPLKLNFIAKREIKKMPVVGWYVSATRQIFIDRSNKEKAQQSMEKAAQRINEGKHVLSYSEGTRSKDGEVKLFKRGAFIIAIEGNIPIVPVAIKGAHECLPAGGFLVNRGTITVDIGKPFYPSDFNAPTPEELAEHARKQVMLLRGDRYKPIRNKPAVRPANK